RRRIGERGGSRKGILGLGRTMPRRSRSAAWATSGCVTQRRRIWPCVVVGHIMRLNTCEFFKDRSRRVSEARMLLPHLEALPQHEGEKADQDMGLNAIL